MFWRWWWPSEEISPLKPHISVDWKAPLNLNYLWLNLPVLQAHLALLGSNHCLMAEAAVPEVVRLMLTALPGCHRLLQYSLPLEKSSIKSKRKACCTPSLPVCIFPHTPTVWVAVGELTALALLWALNQSFFFFFLRPFYWVGSCGHYFEEYWEKIFFLCFGFLITTNHELICYTRKLNKGKQSLGN